MSESKQTAHDEPQPDAFKPQEDSGLRSLQSAYNSREVSLPMLLVGAVTVAAFAGILVALVLFSGGA